MVEPVGGVNMLKDRTGFSPVVVLTLVCVITTFLLAATYGATKDTIAANILREQEMAMKTLLPNADSFMEIPAPEVKGVSKLFEVKQGAETIGYVVMSEGRGYGGKFPVIVAFNLDQTLVGVTITGTQETPGFGKQVENPAYQEQFKGMAADKEFTYSKESGKTNFDQATRATITSKAIKAALNSALKAFQAIGK